MQPAWLGSLQHIIDRVNIAGVRRRQRRCSCNYWQPVDTPISASELSCKLANERPNPSGTELFYSIEDNCAVCLCAVM